MATLHLVRSSAFQRNDFQQCLQNVQDKDEVILLDDGCYNLSHPLFIKVQQKITSASLYIIKEHAFARSILIDNISINDIEMNDVVRLTFKNNNVITWQ